MPNRGTETTTSHKSPPRNFRTHDILIVCTANAPTLCRGHSCSGYRRDLAHILGALDLFVQPSRYEGMPITVLEAMASGCAIIASAVDGNRELILDGVNRLAHRLEFLSFLVTEIGR